MEEHLKLYHRTNDVSNGKLIERFHGPTSMDTTVPPIPFALTPSHTSPSTGFTLNLVNAINAIQNANKIQGMSGPASLPKLVISGNPKEEISSEKVAENSPQSKNKHSLFLTTSTDLSTSTVPTSTVSGSRRRKATTPGRIRVHLSTDVSGSHSDDETHISTADQSVIKQSNSPEDTDNSIEVVPDSVSLSNKRAASEHETWSETTVDCPSPKRSRIAETTQELTEPALQGSGTFVVDCNLAKGSVPQNVPVILSIGNPNNPQPASSTITTSPQPMNSTAPSSVSSTSPLIGQLIPLCGLSDSLLCSVSSTLLANGTTSSAPGLTGHSLIGNALSVPVIDAQTAYPTPTTGSAWLLTSQPNPLTAHVSGASGHLGQLQSTVIVPVPSTLSGEQLLSSATKQLSTLSVDQDGDSTSVNPSAPCNASSHNNGNSTADTIITGMNTIPSNSNLNNLRVSDVLEALKSFAASGNLAASINLPVGGTSSSPTSSTPANPGTVVTRFGVPSQPRPDLVSISCVPKTNPAALGIPVDNSGGMALISSCNNTSSNNNGTSVTNQLTTGKQTVTASGLLSQLAIAAAAVNVPCPETSNNVTDPANLINGLATTVIPAGNHDQALDMSVRSGLIPLNALTPLGNATWLNKSTENSTNYHQLALALDTVDGKPIRSDQATTVHGVMEALNAALKGTFQKSAKLTVSTEAPTKCEPCEENDPRLSESGSHVTSSTTKSPAAKVDPDPVTAPPRLLKTPPTGTQSILVPFPTLSLTSTGYGTPDIANGSDSGRCTLSQLTPAANQQQQHSNVLVNSNSSPSPAVSNQSGNASNSVLLSSPQSQLVNWTQLQAIMAALAAGGTMTVPTQPTSSGNTSVMSGSTVSSTPLSVGPGPVIQTGQTHTASVSVSCSDLPPGAAGHLGSNPILMGHHPASSATVSSTSNSTGLETNSNPTMVLPTLSSMTSVCGLTLTTNPIGQSNAGSTTGVSSVNGCVTPTLKSISLPSTDGLSFTNILAGTHSGTQTASFNPTLIGNSAFINLVSSNRNSSQASVALSPAAAARLITSLTSLSSPVSNPSTGTSASSLLITATPTIAGSSLNASTATTSPNTTTSNTSTTCTASSATGGIVSPITSSSSAAAQLGSATSLVNGTLNVLDPNSQALLAAAAASGHVNLTSFRGSHGSVGLRTLGAAPNGPVIGLLDPRTGLQFSVSTTSPALLATPELVNCLQRGAFTSHNADDHLFSTPRVTEASTAQSGSTTVASTITTATTTTTTAVNAVTSADGNVSSPNSLLRLGKRASGMESVSPYDSHGIDEDWEKLGPSEDSVAVQVNLQSIYAGIKSDPVSSSPLPCLKSPNILPASGTGSTSTRRHGSSSRGSGVAGSSRRSLNTSADSNGAHHGRPHRQNFTPTQNRILTEWYSKHKAKPYPSTDDTKELATISGLSYSQVKKWFANKRARSSSSGLPKPTPPLAPDSSPDPSAAKAIVAAAMAAAVGSSQATGGLDSNEHQIHLQPAFVIASMTASMTESSTEVDENEPEPPLELADGDEDGGITASQTPLHGNVCMNDAATLLSVSTEDEDVPLIVVSEMSVPSVSSTNKDISAAQLEASETNDVECDTPKSSTELYLSSDDVPLHGSDHDNVLGSVSLTAESPVSSPPTLEVPLRSSVTSPINGFLSENSPTSQSNMEESLDKKKKEPHSNKATCEEHSSSLKNPKNLRTRGVTIHAS